MYISFPSVSLLYSYLPMLVLLFGYFKKNRYISKVTNNYKPMRTTNYENQS